MYTLRVVGGGDEVEEPFEGARCRGGGGGFG